MSTWTDFARNANKQCLDDFYVALDRMIAQYKREQQSKRKDNDRE